LPLLRLMDVAAPGLALGQAFGRLGCFSSGDSFGKPFDGPWAVTFTDPHSVAPQGIGLHPTQLYASGALFLIFLVLLWLWPRRRFSGRIFFVYGLLHGAARLIVEQFRGDWRGEPILGLITPTGLFALGMAVLSLLALVWLSYRRRDRNRGDGLAPSA
ncbi:MAG: prolipoprotein diacylglyceryl transferase, partial [Proteobacteria bacterium]|nr:prolipoprotein diacylglyceryl transferase [Pseudomonadota bacterium]